MTSNFITVDLGGKTVHVNLHDGKHLAYCRAWHELGRDIANQLYPTIGAQMRTLFENSKSEGGVASSV